MQRSGTTYSQQLLQENFNVLSLNNHGPRFDLTTPVNLHVEYGGRQGIWKHSVYVPKKYDPTVPTILTSKNPIMWVESICYRKSVNIGATNGRWQPYKKHEDNDYNVGPKGMNIINLALTWKNMYNNWLFDKQETRNQYFFRYEQLLDRTSRETVLQEIKDKFGFQQRYNSWANIQEGQVVLSKDYTSDMTPYYVSQTPKELTTKQIDGIKSTIGEDMLNNMGYTL